MQVHKNELRARMIQVAAHLQQPAKKLLEATSNPRYKLAVRLLNEEQVAKIEDTLFQPVFITTSKSQILPENPDQKRYFDNAFKQQRFLKLAREEFNNLNRKTIEEFNKTVGPTCVAFNKVLNRVYNDVTLIAESFFQEPELFNYALLFKEEAEALSEIFSALAEEWIEQLHTEIKTTKNGTLLYYSEPSFNGYTYLAKKFKQMAKICESKY